MANEILHELPTDDLVKKAKSLRVLLIVFTPVIVLLFFFVGRDYVNGVEIDFSTLTIAICSLGLPATLYPQLKEIKKELDSRK